MPRMSPEMLAASLDTEMVGKKVEEEVKRTLEAPTQEVGFRPGEVIA